MGHAELRTFRGPANGVWRVAFSPDGSRLASAGDDKTVRVWDAVSGRELLTLKGHPEAVGGVAFSPDGWRLASAGDDGTVRLWDARPLTAELQVEREAQGLVDYLFAQPLHKADILERLRTHPAISEPVRQQALEVARHYPDTPRRLNDTAWYVVRYPARSREAYRLALQAAEDACRQEPQNGNYLNTLGVAQYRVGLYPQALATLQRSQSLNVAPARRRIVAEVGRLLMSPWLLPLTRLSTYALPADVAFLAMTHHQLHHKDQAQAALAHLRFLLRQDRWAKDEEAQAFWQEAAALLQENSTPPKQ